MLGVGIYSLILENEEYFDIPKSMYGGLVTVTEYNTGKTYVFAAMAGGYGSGSPTIKELTNISDGKITLDRPGNTTSNPERLLRITNISVGRASFYIRYINAKP